MELGFGKFLFFFSFFFFCGCVGVGITGCFFCFVALSYCMADQSEVLAMSHGKKEFHSGQGKICFSHTKNQSKIHGRKSTFIQKTCVEKFGPDFLCVSPSLSPIFSQRENNLFSLAPRRNKKENEELNCSQRRHSGGY